MVFIFIFLFLYNFLSSTFATTLNGCCYKNQLTVLAYTPQENYHNFLEFSNKKDYDYATKLGQLLIFNITPETEKSFIKFLIEKYKIGGFNLIGSYIAPEKVQRIITFVKDSSQNISLPPPFIAVDQEGEINRLKFIKSLTQRLLETEAKAF